MKTILVMTLLCAFAVPVLAALTDTDLDKIHLIVQEEIKPIKADPNPFFSPVGTASV